MRNRGTKEELAAYQRAYRRNNKKRINAINARYRAKNPDKTRLWQRRAFIKKTGAQPTRQEPQFCEICGRTQQKALALDHDHITSKFRGWLCNNCNLGLGYFGDSIHDLQKAIRYLQTA